MAHASRTGVARACRAIGVVLLALSALTRVVNSTACVLPKDNLQQLVGTVVFGQRSTRKGKQRGYEQMGAWYIRVIGKRRKDVDSNLLVQAVIALGEQLREEERQEHLAEQQRQQAAAPTDDTEADS